jgi:hypothetical protein
MAQEMAEKKRHRVSERVRNWSRDPRNHFLCRHPKTVAILVGNRVAVVVNPGCTYERLWTWIAREPGSCPERGEGFSGG